MELLVFKRIRAMISRVMNIHTYELAFLALAELSESEAEATQSTLVGAVEQAGGQVVSKGDVHYIRLSYEMIKKVGSKNTRHNEAYFSWVKANLAPEALQSIDQLLRSQSEVLRHMIVATSAENSLTDVFSLEQEEETLVAEEKTDETSTDSADEAGEEVAIDDLTRIEGVGPVIATTLANSGITTYALLADTDQSTLESLLEGVRGHHDPATWCEQAALAREEKWDELDALQKNLNGGRAD